MSKTFTPTVYRTLFGEIKVETGKAILFIAREKSGSIIKEEWFPKSQISSFGGTYDEVDGTFQFILASEWILGQKGLLSSSHEVPKVPSYMQTAPVKSWKDPAVFGNTPDISRPNKQDKSNRLPYKDDENSAFDDYFDQLNKHVDEE